MDGIQSAVMLEALSGVVQGVLIGTALAVVAGIVLTRAVAMSASTRFAVWFATLIVVAGLTFAPLATRRTAPPGATAAVAPERTTAPATVMAQPVPIAPAAHSHEPEPLVRLPADGRLPFVAMGIYFAVLALLLLRLLWNYRALVRLKKGCKPAPPELTARLQTWMEQSQCRRPVQLLVSPTARCPLAAGYRNPAVIIPESLLLDLNATQLDHIALHELAHLRRYDDWNTLAQRLLRALFFFHPAVHGISRRLEFEREVACDDSVLAVLDDARPYAESLRRVAEIAPWRGAPILASGALFRKRHIFQRVRTLLNSARDKRPRVSQVTVALVLLVVIGIASELAELPVVIAMFEHGSYQHSKWTMDGRTIEMRLAGEVEFGDDDVSVAHMSPNALLRIEERSGWSSRIVEFRPGASGQPEIRYRANGAERPLDDAGRAWIATILPRIIRENGINAEDRARRILDRGGASALVQEIDHISSDHVRARYIRTGIDSGKIDAEGLRQIATRIRRISSDHEKANTIIEVMPVYIRQELHGALFDAVDTINSDHDKARTLSAFMNSVSLDPAAITGLIRLTRRINSDHERAGVLTHLLGERNTNPAEMNEICQAAEGISSDNEKANVLIAASSRLTTACFTTVRTIGSDHEKRRVLERVLSSGVTRETAHAAIVAAAGIGSDHEKAQVLIRAAEQFPDEETRKLIRKSGEGISSDEEHRKLTERLSAE